MTTASRATADLLTQMTLPEKIAQLTSIIPTLLFGSDGLHAGNAAAKLGRGIGFLEPHMGGFPRDAAELARLNNVVQRYLVEQTRLGIPAIMHVEALNGVNGPSFTPFPTAIALAATWNPAAVGEMADLTRRQMRATGLHQALSPVLDIARDPRWGRVHETYGEDPYLVTALGVAFIRALQGEDRAEGVVATAKHFLGYAATEGGLNMASTTVTPRELLEVHARPFAAAIQLAGLGSIMNSLSEWDGVPAAADARIFRDLLRDELGFVGTVVSDWGSVENLISHHRTAVDLEDAAVQAITAGIDAELPAPAAYAEPLANAVRNGRVDVALIDEAVQRILGQKHELGLFDDPYVSEDRATILDLAHDGTALSQRLARESVTLLKNDGGHLPLASNVARIAIIGPHATSVDSAFPPYTNPEFTALTRAMFAGMQSSMVGVEDASAFGFDAKYIQDEVGDLLEMPGEQLVAELYGAVSLAEAIAQQFPSAEVVTAAGSGLLSGDELIEEAVQVAATADVVVLALGGRARWFYGERTEGEGADASDTSLPAVQRELAARIRDVGRPTVAVVFSGRAMALGELDQNVDALLFGYHGAQFGTRAVAEVLAGAVAPSGRLPYSVPARPGQAPLHSGQRFGTGYRRAEGDPMGGYIDGPAAPLYAFGHGLSYTTFEYSDLALSADTVEPGGTLAVRATVRNTGSRAGSETVQLYIEDVANGISRPALQLAGFEAVTLEPGGSSEVEFVLDTAVLAYLDLPRERWILEPGPIRVRVGAASDDLRLDATVELVGATTDLSARRVFLTDSRSLASSPDHRTEGRR